MKIALENKSYYYLMIRDMKLKFSNRKSESWVMAEATKFKRFSVVSMNPLFYSLEFTKILISQICNIVLEESRRIYVISIKN